ncbi:hypothetical protein CUMW_186880, partial [Citrus unshiu]
VLHFTENLSLQSNEDVPSSEYIVTEAGTGARRFQEPIDDVGSTISGLDKQVRVSAVVLKAVIHFTESLSLRSNEDVPSSEYVVTEAATEARIFQEPVEDVGSTVNGLEICALAVFYLVLEAASFLLDIFGKSKRRIVLAAFLLSAFGFAITMSTHSWMCAVALAAGNQVHMLDAIRNEDLEANGSMPMLADFR